MQFNNNTAKTCFLRSNLHRISNDWKGAIFLPIDYFQEERIQLFLKEG